MAIGRRVVFCGHSSRIGTARAAIMLIVLSVVSCVLVLVELLALVASASRAVPKVLHSLGGLATRVGAARFVV